MARRGRGRRSVPASLRRATRRPRSALCSTLPVVTFGIRAAGSCRTVVNLCFVVEQAPGEDARHGYVHAGEIAFVVLRFSARPGIDKAYGVSKLHETLGIAVADMIFVGDAIFPGGNDYPAKQAGAESIRVRDPHETKRVVEAICACLETGDSHRQIAS